MNTTGLFGLCILFVLTLLIGRSNEGIATQSDEATYGSEDLGRAASEQRDELLQRANLQRARGEYAAALATVKDGLALADQRGDIRNRAELLHVAGRIYWALADYTKSIEVHFEEMAIGQRLQSYRIQAASHHGLSITYGSLRDGATSLKHSELALELANRIRDKRLLASAHNGMGNVALTVLLDYTKARSHHLEALTLRQEIGDEAGVADSYTNLGVVLIGMGEEDGALAYLHKALPIYERLEQKRHEANTHCRIGNVLRRMGRVPEALEANEVALKIARALGSKDVLASVYRELALTHEALGDHRQALLFERQMTGTTASIRDEKTRQRTAELQARFETERREHEIARLRSAETTQRETLRLRRSQTLLGITALAAVIVILGAMVFAQRTRIVNDRRMRAATDAARDRAEKAERLKSRLLLIASHDLKTPLSAMIAAAERMPESQPDARRVLEFSAGIKADASRMITLVRDFLDVAAIEDGRLLLHRERTDMAETVRAALKSLGPLAAKKNQRLEGAGLDAPLLASVDVERVRQILDNLVGNALKFTPAGGKVELSAGRAGTDWVYVQVADNGPGLTPEDVIKIFSPRPCSSAKPTGGESSTGLGLFITRELIAYHGGRLEIESQPGRGGIFRFLLPAAP